MCDDADAAAFVYMYRTDTQIPDIFVLLDDSSSAALLHFSSYDGDAAALRSNKSIILQLFFFFVFVFFPEMLAVRDSRLAFFVLWVWFLKVPCSMESTS